MPTSTTLSPSGRPEVREVDPAHPPPPWLAERLATYLDEHPRWTDSEVPLFPGRPGR